MNVEPIPYRPEQRPVPRTSRRRRPPAAAILTDGVLFLMVSAVLAFMGQYFTLQSVGSPDSSSPSLFFVCAALAGLIGAICTLIGIRRLADKIDAIR